MRITPSVYIAYPHKADEEPKFKLCDSYDIVMDCVYSKEEALSFTTGLDDKIINELKLNTNNNKDIFNLNYYDNFMENRVQSWNAKQLCLKNKIE